MNTELKPLSNDKFLFSWEVWHDKHDLRISGKCNSKPLARDNISNAVRVLQEEVQRLERIIGVTAFLYNEGII